MALGMRKTDNCHALQFPIGYAMDGRTTMWSRFPQPFSAHSSGIQRRCTWPFLPVMNLNAWVEPSAQFLFFLRTHTQCVLHTLTHTHIDKHRRTQTYIHTQVLRHNHANTSLIWRSIDSIRGLKIHTSYKQPKYQFKIQLLTNLIILFIHNLIQ